MIADDIHVLLMAAFLAAAAALSSSAVRCCSRITKRTKHDKNTDTNSQRKQTQNLLDDDLLQLL